MRNIEEQLWNYLDGACTIQEREVIEHLIATDEEYRIKFEEIKAFSLGLQGMELDAPPMAFTYNVMETIRMEEAKKPLKSAIDNRIIKGIAAFFIITIVTLVGIALANADWSVAKGANSFAIPKMQLPTFKNYLSSSIIKSFLFFDVIIGLYLFDSYLRRRKVQQEV